MENFTKILSIGQTRDSGTLYANVRFTDGKLSITGVVGPQANGNCRGSCGQIVMGEWDIKEYALGWDADLVQQFRDVWNRWHLNGLKAGTPAQEQFLRDNPVMAIYPVSHYTKACEALDAAGLLVDNGYKYGSAWKLEEVPEDVLQWLYDLPPATSTPAWI